ncbi:glycosyltransferase [Alteromonas sp. ASW11-19]|uniref:Glycosyltransferase n=1 Tax=Alteromonas salexigens TaxID=2982530 RepID=A0ABT2VT63_9ALTE|nr:glycosyltransferase [Alteromonas salexigens]MCU7555628.1 glycosyltransferase [Alteromonas salexigens]
MSGTVVMTEQSSTGSSGLLNVAHVTFDMRIGGTEMVIKNIIEGSRDRINHYLFCVEAPLGPWGESLRDENVITACCQRNEGLDVKVIKQLRAFIREHAINVVHCHQYTPWVYGALAALSTSCSVVFTEHGRFYPDSTTWKRRVINPLLLKATDRVTAISQATRNALSRFEYIPQDRSEVIYNGIAPLRPDANNVEQLKHTLGLAESDTVVGTIARLDPIKNQLMMLRAFADACQAQRNLKLLIVGDGEMRESLEALTDDLDLRDRVIFTGYITNPTDYLALMRYFLLPSLSEGTSMTLLEALSIGIPCIVTDAGGNAEVITDGVTGFVTPNDDQDAYSQALMNAALLSESEYQGLAGNCINDFKARFARSIMNEQYVSLYQEVN